MATGSMYVNKIATCNIVDKMTDGNIYMNKMVAFKLVWGEDDRQQHERGQNSIWLEESPRFITYKSNKVATTCVVYIFCTVIKYQILKHFYQMLRKNSKNVLIFSTNLFYKFLVYLR